MSEAVALYAGRAGILTVKRPSFETNVLTFGVSDLATRQQIMSANAQMNGFTAIRPLLAYLGT